MSHSNKSKKMSHKERELERRNIEPQRFALIFDPPSVVLEYVDKSKDSLRHRKMQIPTSCRHDVEVAVNKLVRHNNIHLHASVVSKEQVTRLVAKLLQRKATGNPDKPSGPQQSKSPPRSSPARSPSAEVPKTTAPLKHEQDLSAAKNISSPPQLSAPLGPLPALRQPELAPIVAPIVDKRPVGEHEAPSSSLGTSPKEEPSKLLKEPPSPAPKMEPEESPQPTQVTSSQGSGVMTGGLNSSSGEIGEEIEDDIDFGSDLDDLDLGLDDSPPAKPPGGLGGAQNGNDRPGVGGDPYSTEAVASDPFGGGDPFAQATPQLDKGAVMAGKVDLNKVDEDILKQAKALMEEDFSENALKPGDDGYVYDKRVEFEAVEGPGEWDDSDSDEEDGEEQVVDAGSPLSDGSDSPLDTGSPLGDDEDDDMYNF